jgi:hypothetical protein
VITEAEELKRILDELQVAFDILCDDEEYYGREGLVTETHKQLGRVHLALTKMLSRLLSASTMTEPSEPVRSGPVTRGEILDQARSAVTRTVYGTVPEDSFAKIAALWSVRLGGTVTPDQVTIMMIDLKTVRAWTNPSHTDSWADMAGYAACGGELGAK